MRGTTQRRRRPASPLTATPRGALPAPQVIKGSDNPLARAAAAGKPTAHLHRAAAHDLDVLQQLAVLERTLATWVRDSAYGVGEEWLEAASCLAPREGAAAGGEPQPVPQALLGGEAPPPQLLAPLTDAQRAGLRAELAGKWKWSEGVEVRAGRAACWPAGHASGRCGGRRQQCPAPGLNNTHECRLKRRALSLCPPPPCSSWCATTRRTAADWSASTGC